MTAFGNSVICFLFLIMGHPVLCLDHSATFEFNISSIYSPVLSPVQCSEYKCPVKVCLKHYQIFFVDDEPCTFGSMILDFNKQKSATFHIFERIPKDFTLVISLFGTGSDEPAVYSALVQDRFSKEKKEKFVLFTALEKVVIDVKYQVSCSKYHFGTDCGKICVPNKRYTCGVDGEKICQPGYSGPNCDQSSGKCSSSCKNGVCDRHGTLEFCRCFDGYKGENCDQCIPSPGCNGTCNKAYECICPPGFGGRNCTHDLTICSRTKPCKNGGTCDLTANGNPICVCLPGYSGDSCEERILSCDPNPCMNNGECSMLEGDVDYHCQCPKGYTGRFCQIKAETCRDRPCMNGAVCKTPTDAGFYCECKGAWMGVNCDIPITRCRPDSCYNDGKCVNDFSTDLGFRCENCSAGFFGLRCEKRLDEEIETEKKCSNHKCYNNGICRMQRGQPRCYCSRGFDGDHCEIDLNDCSATACKHGKVCNVNNGFRCECPRGTFGEFCQNQIPGFEGHEKFIQSSVGLSFLGFVFGAIFVLIIMAVFAVLVFIFWKTKISKNFQKGNTQTGDFTQNSTIASPDKQKHFVFVTAPKQGAPFFHSAPEFEDRYVEDPTWRPATPKNLAAAAERASRLVLQDSPSTASSIYHEISSPQTK